MGVTGGELLVSEAALQVIAALLGEAVAEGALGDLLVGTVLDVTDDGLRAVVERAVDAV